MTKAVEKWTAEKVRALGVRTDLVTACSIALGCGKNKAWELFHSGELPFPALRVGRRVVVPTAPLLALLGLTDSDATEASRQKNGRLGACTAGRPRIHEGTHP